MHPAPAVSTRAVCMSLAIGCMDDTGGSVLITERAMAVDWSHPGTILHHLALLEAMP